MKKVFLILVFGFFLLFPPKKAFAESDYFELDLSHRQNQDVVAEVNQTLRQHKKVKISKGEYLVSNSIRMEKDNELDFNGSKISKIKGTGDPIIINRLSGNENVTEYNGNGFIVKNAIFDLKDSNAIAMSHAPYAVIENIRMTNINGNWTHAIEVNSSKDVVIRNNVFENQLNTKPTNFDRIWENKEIIQIESSNAKEGYPFGGTWDNTQSKNILVENNIFENYHIAVGDHSPRDAAPKTNIVIQNNIFKNKIHESSKPFQLYTYDGVKICGNKNAQNMPENGFYELNSKNIEVSENCEK